MALVKKFERASIEKARVHGPVECTYAIFSAAGGQKYVQLNTFGSRDRENPGKQSQTIQLNEAAVKELMKILAEEFL